MLPSRALLSSVSIAEGLDFLLLGPNTDFSWWEMNVQRISYSICALFLVLQQSDAGVSAPLFLMACWSRVNKWAEMLKYCIFLQARSQGSLELALHSVSAWGDFCIYVYIVVRSSKKMFLACITWFILTCGIYISQELPCYSDDRKGAYVTWNSSILSSFFFFYLYVVAM